MRLWGLRHSLTLIATSLVVVVIILTTILVVFLVVSLRVFVFVIAMVHMITLMHDLKKRLKNLGHMRVT